MSSGCFKRCQRVCDGSRVHIASYFTVPSQDFFLHLVICEFVTLGIADFTNTKSMGSQYLNVHVLKPNSVWLFICETMGIANFANTKSIGKVNFDHA